MGLIEMSVKTPSEKFLMTVPKPIHDWLSKEAERLGVSVQDRIRAMLTEEEKRQSKYLGSFLSKEIEERCYQLGKEIYDEFATERKRLTVLQVPRDYSSKKYKEFSLEHYPDDSIVFPIMQKSFYPFLCGESENKLDEYNIGKAAKQIAELENKLLSTCEDGAKLFEIFPFKCIIQFKNGEWIGLFRLSLNSEKTPTMTDVQRVTS